MNWKDELSEQLATLSKADFDYIETKDINRISELDNNCTGIYMESTIIYFEIKNALAVLKDQGRRKMAQAYTMYYRILSALAEKDGGFVNCYSPNSFVVIFPGKEDEQVTAVKCAMKIAYALSETYKDKFAHIAGLEFAMGMDHGHIMGTKTGSDNSMEHLSWFGTCIYKAQRICKECSRPFYVGISGIIYHSLDEDMRITYRRILGIKKSVEVWTKVSYQYENVKKHLYQTNQKISIDEEA